MQKLIALISVLGVAVGCSSSSGNINAMSRADQAADLADALIAENKSDPTLLPVTGQATYAGFGTLDLAIGGTTQS